MKVLDEEDVWRLDHVADGLDALADAQARMAQLLYTPKRHREPAKAIGELEAFIRRAGEQLEFSITEIRDLLHGDVDETDVERKEEKTEAESKAISRLQAFIEGKTP
jgi:hypothetical protein